MTNSKYTDTLSKNFF